VKGKGDGMERERRGGNVEFHHLRLSKPMYCEAVNF